MATTSEPRSDFVRLMAAVQAGDDAAVRQLHDYYAPYILRAVRRRLSLRMRSKFDSIDFAQDVWASFFADSVDKYELHSPAELIGLLTAMARNKIIERHRTYRPEVKASPVDQKPFDTQLGQIAHVPAPQQTPSQIVMNEEAWADLLASQPPVYRRILLLLREGQTHETIMQELGVSLRTIQRVLRKLAP